MLKYNSKGNVELSYLNCTQTKTRLWLCGLKFLTIGSFVKLKSDISISSIIIIFVEDTWKYHINVKLSTHCEIWQFILIGYPCY